MFRRYKFKVTPSTTDASGLFEGAAGTKSPPRGDISMAQIISPNAKPGSAQALYSSQHDRHKNLFPAVGNSVIARTDKVQLSSVKKNGGRAFSKQREAEFQNKVAVYRTPSKSAEGSMSVFDNEFEVGTGSKKKLFSSSQRSASSLKSESKHLSSSHRSASSLKSESKLLSSSQRLSTSESKIRSSSVSLQSSAVNTRTSKSLQSSAVNTRTSKSLQSSAVNTRTSKTVAAIASPKKKTEMDLSIQYLQIELANAMAEAASHKQRSKAELEEAQRIIGEITNERDDLLVKIELLNKNLKEQLTVEFENLKVALANKTVDVENERKIKLEVTKERDELEAQIQSIKAEFESNLTNAQFRLELEQSQHATEQQRLQFDLEAAQRTINQITIERDELFLKVEHISKLSAEIEKLKVVLTTETANVETERNAKLEAFKELDDLRAQIKITKAANQSNVRKLQSRLEEMKVQIATQEKSFNVELTTAKRLTQQITAEREELLAKVEDLEEIQSTTVNTVDIESQYTAEIDELRLALTTMTVNVEKERHAKLEAFTERDALKAQIQLMSAQAESNLKNERSRVEKEQSNYKLELEHAQSTIKQLTMERNELRDKIQYNLKIELDLEKNANAEAASFQDEQRKEIERLKTSQSSKVESIKGKHSAEVEELKAALAAEKVNVTNEYDAKLVVTKERDELKAQLSNQNEKIKALQEELSKARAAKTESLQQMETFKSEIQSAESKLVDNSTAALFIAETKLIANRPKELISWKDELSFPMLVKNDETGERNVLCLNQLEAQNVPDMSAYSDDGRSELYLKISLPPTANATDGEDGTYLLWQLYSYEHRMFDKLIAQGLVRVRGPATGEKKGRILLHLDCVVKGLADSVLFRCQYEWKSSTNGIKQPKLRNAGMAADLSNDLRQHLKAKHLMFEARQRYEHIFEHMDYQIKQILGKSCPNVSVELYRNHTIVVLQAIEFAQGKSKLTNMAEIILFQVAKAIKEVHKLSLEHGIPPLIVSVEGHTNCPEPSKQSSPFHMQLSVKRALVCRQYLEHAGVDPRYLQSKGFGGTVPISESNPQANQRTEFNCNFEEEIKRQIAAELEQS